MGVIRTYTAIYSVRRKEGEREGSEREREGGRKGEKEGKEREGEQ